jgi:hypothetical protein
MKHESIRVRMPMSDRRVRLAGKVCLCVLLSQFANIAFSSDRQTVYMEIGPGDPAILPSGYARAISVVYPAFVSHIQPESGEVENDLDGFFRDPMNYAVMLYMGENENYVVRFSPRDSEGRPVGMGGGAKYVVDRTLFEIISTEYGM